jgi:hypothetical protein
MEIIVNMVITVYINIRALPFISTRRPKGLRLPSSDAMESSGSIGGSDPELGLVTWGTEGRETQHSKDRMERVI